MLILDPWSFRRVVVGVVAYHDAKLRNEDGDAAFTEATGGMKLDAEDCPSLIDYPDLARSALVVVELDHAYRTKEEPWSDERLVEWREERRLAYNRYDMLRLMVDHASPGLLIKSPEAS